MLFASPLIRGRLIRRYKRFLADIELETGETITAHCANPGSMMAVAVADAPAFVSKSDSKTRKLPYSWELVDLGGALVAINTSNPNKIAAEAIARRAIPELAGYEGMRREVNYGERSRIDLLLEGGAKGAKTGPCYVEIKNVHLVRNPGLAEFPDSVTTRGAKHMAELAALARGGTRAVVVFVVQRGDCTRFAPAADLDPAYADALRLAAAAGVELLCYDCEVTTQEVRLRKALPIEI
ncbi:MAG: DNA/RNA nuclease SfsA [Parvularculaceae bacterium]